MDKDSVFHLLVIDDDQLIADSIRMVLPPTWKMTWIRDFKIPNPKIMVHCALVDMHMNGKAEGLEVIRQLKENQPQLQIMAMSGDLSLPIMESGIKLGATKFLAKPISSTELLSNLEKIEALWLMRARESKGPGSYQWIGNCDASEKLKQKIASLRGEDGPILILGETGSGKEVVARLLNAQETARPFVAVNMAGISENLFESEFFGHIKGAFTGADSQKVGLIEAADGGDLFLDEIEALPLIAQAKLLRFLESGEYRKVGSKDIRKGSCRIIVASNKDLSKMVHAGEFREDLMFRLSGKTIQLPTLRERKQDIAVLAQHFVKHNTSKAIKQFLPEALETLTKYSWPGNVRELKRICEQLVISAPLPFIRSHDVIALLTPSVSTEMLSFDEGQSLSSLVESFEKRVIQTCLSQNPDVEKAAEILKVSRSNLYKKIKDLNIQL